MHYHTEKRVNKLLTLTLLTAAFFLTGCHSKQETLAIGVISRIENAEMAAAFETAFLQEATVRQMKGYFFNELDSLHTTDPDTVIPKLDALALPATLLNQRLQKLVQRNRRGTLQLVADSLSNADIYKAARYAGEHILSEFGPSGRFGIFVSSLDNSKSSEAIRGFREALMSGQARWRQVNIITYGEDMTLALQQFRRLNRFGARTIWFFADENKAFVQAIKNDKKNNYFICINLHGKDYYINLLKENFIDACIVPNYPEQALTCVKNLAQLAVEGTSSTSVSFQPSILTCGSNGLNFR